MRKRRVLGSVISLAVIAGAVLYYAAVAPALVGKGRVATAFAAGVRDALGLEVRWRTAAFNLWPRPTVTLGDVAVATAAGKEIIRAEGLGLGLSYLGFLRLKPSVATVALVRPRADVAAGDIALAEAGAAPPFRGTFVVTEGFLRFGGAGRTVLLDGVSAKLRCRAIWGEELAIRGKLSSRRLNFGAGAGEGGAGISVAAEGNIVYRPAPPGGRVSVEKLDFIFGKARLTVAGEVQTGPGEKDIDLQLTGKDMELAHVLPAIAPRFGEAELDGELNVSVTVKGKWDEGRRPDVRGELTVAKGALRPPEGNGVTGVVAKVRFEGDKYVIEDFRGLTTKGGFKGFGTVLPQKGWPFEVRLEGAIPLEVAATICGFPPGYMLRGPSQVDLDVDGELSSPARTALDGTVELLGCNLRLKPFAQPFRGLRGTIYFDGYRAKAGKVTGKLGDGGFELGGSWQGFATPRVDVVVVGGDIDLDAALPSAETRRRWAQSGTGPRGLPGREIAVTGKVRLKKCTLLSVRAQKLEAAFEYAGGIVNIKGLKFNAYDGDVRAEATIYTAARPRYTFSATVRNVRLGVFLTENQYLENVLTGKFSADVVFSAEGTSYEDVKGSFGGKGSVELSGGRVAELPLLDELAKWSRIELFAPLQISKLWAVADARAGVIKTADFRIENPDMTIEAAGEVDLAKKLNFTVRTTFEKAAAARLAREGKALALVRDDDGRAHFNFIVTGEVARPAFQLDAASMLGAAGEVSPGAAAGGTAEVGEIF